MLRNPRIVPEKPRKFTTRLVCCGHKLTRLKDVSCQKAAHLKNILQTVGLGERFGQIDYDTYVKLLMHLKNTESRLI